MVLWLVGIEVMRLVIEDESRYSVSGVYRTSLLWLTTWRETWSPRVCHVDKAGLRLLRAISCSRSWTKWSIVLWLILILQPIIGNRSIVACCSINITSWRSNLDKEYVSYIDRPESPMHVRRWDVHKCRVDATENREFVVKNCMAHTKSRSKRSRDGESSE